MQMRDSKINSTQTATLQIHISEQEKILRKAYLVKHYGSFHMGKPVTK